MKHYIYIMIIGLAFSSCKKFLDVQPESDVTKEDLFKTEEGFKEALNGVYNLNAEKSLYGENLTFGNLDIMAQNYDFTDANARKVQSFQYADQFLISKNDEIWASAYKAIGNINSILEAVEKNRAVLYDKNYELIKGEALTLRAYLHFDLLRMFAPSFVSKPDAVAIPYVTIVSIKSTPFSTTTEVLNKIIADLTEAKQLLKVADPILSAAYIVGYPDKTYPNDFPEAMKSTETSSNSLFLQNRRHRMNYYTVCGELARVYLYKGDMVNSLANAKEVIDSGKFPWTKRQDFFSSNSQQLDKVFYPEIITGWYVPQSQELLNSLFSNDNARNAPTITQKELIYEKGSVGADDWRFRQWFRDVPVNNSPGRSLVQKYTWNGTPQRNMHPTVAPAMRLSEMYYIAAEATFDTDPIKATAYVDSVRFHRGIGVALPKTIAKPDFIKKLVEEARKEFYGESQIFYMYKRLNRDVINTNGMVYPASDRIFVFPLPLDELAYRN
ncbi:RagB/SusD family nutrient uptake outer membrane protein [Arcticibacter tournemirensis]|uniref:RagB/SusD family nutrient uptake outer membrane protein n=1 Tax=Arcticibacter tournemirensis TaxID=699437 RepID=A0A4Q0MFE3_9SPHI|nr:RagB/SusD family nutrient uptake outer membrane protein [Arcticibacter tournemirensis]RXF72207.1 RagB/SusD family nutrient uptake outer membrane protein [Arcticibacter tournemirensis]